MILCLDRFVLQQKGAGFHGELRGVLESNKVHSLQNQRKSPDLIAQRKADSMPREVTGRFFS